MAERLPEGPPEGTILPGLDLRPREAIPRLRRATLRLAGDVIPRGRTRPLWVFTAAIAAAELLADSGSPGAATFADATLVAIMIAWHLRHAETAEGRLSMGLVVLPLLRLFSFTAVITSLPPAVAYATTAVPVAVSVVLTAQVLGLSSRDMGLRWISFTWSPDERVPAAAVSACLPLGLIGYLFLPPATSLSFGFVSMAGMAVALAFAAGVEEVVFRGLLQTLARGTFAYERAAIAYAASLTGLMYLGSGSVAFALCLGLMSLLWGWVALRSESLWPAIGGHAVFIVSAGVFWPWVVHLLG